LILSFFGTEGKAQICPVKIYTWFFVLLTLAQLVFTAAWFLFTRRMGRVVLVSSLIYAAVMIVGYIAFEVERYRKRKKDLLEDLTSSNH
jgi:hypothetical protein